MRDEIVRVILADDHAMLREGLRLLLCSAPDIAVIGEAGSGAATLALTRSVSPDVLVLDLEMPDGDGSSVLRELQRTAPGVRVLILTVHPEHEGLLEMLEGGARGYLAKEAAACDLIDAIRVVAAGDVYVRPAAARLLAAAVVPHRSANTARSRFQDLSTREQAVVRLVAQGYSGAETARQLRISTKTVDAYRHRVQQKLGLTHRTEYVRFAVEAGLLANARSPDVSGQPEGSLP
ncbi:MAG TPA: response regulator transcription factor [Gemmatimonadaceae bacterium]